MRRTVSVVGLAVLSGSAYMCTHGSGGSGRAGGTPHLIDSSAGAAASGGSGGSTAASGGSGGLPATAGRGGTVATGGSDAGLTGIFPCASVPPSSEPVPAGWPAGAKRLPALDPDVYVFEVPADPKPLTWKACGPGCEELVNTWAPSQAHGLWADTLGAAVGNTPWLVLVQNYPDYVGTWIGSADGAPVHILAEEIPHGTVPHGGAARSGITRAGFAVTVEAHETLSWVLGAPLDGPLRCMFREHVASGVPQVFEDLATLSSRWALWSASGGPPRTGELPMGSPSAAVPTGIDAPPGFTSVDALRALPEGFVMAAYRPESTALFVWTPAGGTVPFVAAPAPDASDEPVASDGNRIAWLHGSGLSTDGGYDLWSKVELMLATDSGQFPVTGTSIGVLPTFEAGTGTWGPWHLRGDYLAGWLRSGWPHPPSLGPLVPFVLRLSDQHIWFIPPRGPDVLWRNILYLSDNEIGLLERTLKSYTGYADTVVRYRLDSLGPGETLADALAGGVP